MATDPSNTLTLIPSTPAPNNDLPAAQFPSLSRIVEVDMVGPPAANRQHQSLERRDETLRTSVNSLIELANVLDTWFLRRNGAAQKDGTAGATADMPMNGHSLKGLRAAVANGEAVRFEEFAALQQLFAAMSGVTTGEMKPFGNTVPFGYLECNAAIWSAAGFSVDGGPLNPYPLGLTWAMLQPLRTYLGSLYGGDGVNSFGVPDCRGRAVIGAGNGPGMTARAVGEKGGEEYHVLNINEIPPHDHWHDHEYDQPYSSTAAPYPLPGGVAYFRAARTSGGGRTDGSGWGHNNMQPYIACRVGIKF